MTLGLPEAIARYHELLTDEIAAESQAMLDEEQRRRGVYFGPRPLCTALRPRFLTGDQYRYVRERCAVLLRAMRRLHQAALASEPLRRQFRLTEWEEEFVALDPGIPDPSPTSRFDSFYFPDTGGLWLTEYNAETPTGAAYGDTLADVFLALPVMRQFLRSVDVRPVPGRHGILHALLASYFHWKTTRTAPRIAILDWREVPTYSEFEIIRDTFVAAGIPTTICDPRDLDYRPSKELFANGERIDLVYRRVLINDILARESDCRALLDAYADRAVCVANTFRCKIPHKKAFFAVLTEPRHAALFNSDEQALIRRHIPWTVLVEERRISRDGESFDLVPYLRKQRDTLVIKPNDEYGGTGVTLGWETDERAWDDAIAHALRERDRGWVAQERIAVRRELFPICEGGGVVMRDMLVDLAPYVFRGKFAGFLTRLSATGLANVTSGGGQVPAFVVTRKAEVSR